MALPSSTFDWKIRDGKNEIPIEERSGDEVTFISGMKSKDETKETEVDLVAPGSSVVNYAFDVTPSRLISGLITERGVCDASERAVLEIFPERKQQI